MADHLGAEPACDALRQLELVPPPCARQGGLGPVEHEQPGERQRAAVLGHGPRFPGNDRAPDGRLRQRA
jgi:hypothetical protein